MTVEALATAWGISRTAVMRYVRQGRIDVTGVKRSAAGREQLLLRQAPKPKRLPWGSLTHPELRGLEA